MKNKWSIENTKGNLTSGKFITLDVLENFLKKKKGKNKKELLKNLYV